MNNEQLESCLKRLKSSSCGPGAADESIEKLMMNEFATLKSNQIRTRRIALVFGIILLCGTGFVAAGGDVSVKNYIGSSSDVDGNPIHESESLWFYLIRHVHAHLGRHGSMHHGSEQVDGSR